MSKYFKSLRKYKAPVPRPAVEIQKEYSQVISDAGQAQYQVYVYTQAVEKFNEQLKNLNQEFSARRELDQKEAAPVEPVSTEVKNA